MFLNVSGKKCVVVGGGEVAERKSLLLNKSGAAVTVVASVITALLEEMKTKGAISVINRDFRSGDLKGVAIAIAATDNRAVNMLVAIEGRAGGTLVNVVDDAKNSDFILPSIVRRGDVTIAISTSGRSPALARKLRLEIEKHLGEEVDSLAVLLSEVRDELRQQGKKVDGDEWQKCLDLAALTTGIREGKYAETKKELISL
ncbi:MAG: bifunctional precorrin-2 dehydrogenase/sirohydrochlorin ferrochelatase, partial [Dehalococcoidia bacterium]|nr:bifunctional precorrin-2 dehydrogenase/sirohydrochlorin ferrochelatase [Dehalococcoidia bacterium]